MFLERLGLLIRWGCLFFFVCFDDSPQQLLTKLHLGHRLWVLMSLLRRSNLLIWCECTCSSWHCSSYSWPILRNMVDTSMCVLLPLNTIFAWYRPPWFPLDYPLMLSFGHAIIFRKFQCPFFIKDGSRYWGGSAHELLGKNGKIPLHILNG